MIRRLFKKFSRTADLPEKEIILHVGMDKTGTSAIQAFLHKNRERLLKESGIYYPETGLWQDYSHHPYAFSLFEMNGFSMRDFAKLSRKLCRETRDIQRVLISSECLFKAPTREEFDRFREFVNKNFSTVKVIVYLRRQDLWVESRHKHSIISGQELSIEKLSTPHFCDYKKFIDLWAEEYGKENIVVRPYEKSQFVGGSIFSDFLSLFSIKLDDQWKLPERQVNVGLGNLETDFKRFCNRIGFTRGMVDKLNSLLIEYTAQFESGNKAKLISKEECRLILSRYEGVNEGIKERYLKGRTNPLFTESIEPEGSEWDVYRGMDEGEFRSVLDFIKSKDRAVYRKIVDLAGNSLDTAGIDVQKWSKLVSTSLN